MFYLISGEIGSGKSMYAKYIIKNSESPSVMRIKSFAEPIKRMLGEILCPEIKNPDDRVEWLNSHKNDAQERFGGRSVRYMMQTLGTDWGRNIIDSDIWTNAALANIDKASITIFDDVRFYNEIKAVRDYAAKISEEMNLSVRVTHVHIINDMFETDDVAASHESEDSVSILGKHADKVVKSSDFLYYDNSGKLLMRQK